MFLMVFLKASVWSWVFLKYGYKFWKRTKYNGSFNDFYGILEFGKDSSGNPEFERKLILKSLIKTLRYILKEFICFHLKKIVLGVSLRCS